MNDEQAYAEIMNMFRYFYKDQWAPGHIFDGKSRVWVKIFNKLIEDKIIARKKIHNGYSYKWAAVWPEGY